MTKPHPQSFWAFWERQPKNGRFLLDWTAWREPNVLLAMPTTERVEFHVRLALYHSLNWTGNQDPEIAWCPDSPVDLLRGIDRLSTKNNGRGPEISCGPFASLYVGLLAAFSIPARRVWSSRITDSFQDNVAEYWDATAKRWVLVIPQLNLHFEHPTAGHRMSLREWCAADRMGTHAKPVALSGDGKPRWPDKSPDMRQWRGMSGNPHVMRGNWPYGGTETRPAGCWDWLQVWPRVGNAVEASVMAGDPAKQRCWRYGEYEESVIWEGAEVGT